jgi:hypothetical protein
MKFFYSTLAGLFLLALSAFGQTYLAPENNFKVADFFPDYSAVSAFDIFNDQLFIHDGDTIYQVDMTKGSEIGRFGEPAEYDATNYVSFLTVSPDGTTLWTGYTSDGNADDRIYSIDVETDSWKLQARFPGNFDLIFWNNSILVSGLNSVTWGDPNAIYVLDTSGQDQHRMIIETGGNSAGMAVDSLGSIYFGTSYFMNPNAIFRWDSTQLAQVLNSIDLDTLKISDGEKLTNIPAGANDCEVDEAGNLVFNLNLYGGLKVLAKWNGNAGNGMNLDTIAVAAGEWDWLGSLSTMGDVDKPEMENRIVTFSFGQPLADVHTADYLPVVANPVADILILNPISDTVIDLSNVFSDPDDDNAGILKTVKSNSNEALLGASVSGDQLTLSYVVTRSAGGEAIIIIEGVSEGLAVTDTFKVTIETFIGTEDRSMYNVAVFPNPSTGLFKVWVEGVDEADLKLYNMTGTLVHEDAHFTPGRTINLRNQPEGAYLVRIKAGREVTGKILYKQ